MTDELRDRMRDLARQAHETSAPGLADVVHRRDRRQRNTVLATGLAVVAVIGSTALFLDPFGDNSSIQPLGPGTSTSSVALTTEPSPTTTDPAQTTASDQTSTSTTSRTSTTTGSETEEPTLAIDLGSLADPEELAAAGITVLSDQPIDADGQPTLPPMCQASSWQEQHSNPDDRVSGGYLVEGGQLVFDLLAYPDGVTANAALVKLKEDARACPTVNEFLTIEVTAVAASIGDEFVVFALDAESGEDGSVERIWVTIARIDNVLVAATVDRDPGYAGDVSLDQQLSRDAAEAGVSHLQSD